MTDNYAVPVIDLIRLMTEEWEPGRWYRIPFTRKYFRAFDNGWWAEIEWANATLESQDLDDANHRHEPELRPLFGDELPDADRRRLARLESERMRANDACYYWRIYDRAGNILNHGSAGGKGLESLNRHTIYDVQNVVTDCVESLKAGEGLDPVPIVRETGV